MEKRPPPQSSPLRLLYLVATLPFILAAILYFTGAFRPKTPDQPSTPSPRPTPIQSPAAQGSASPAAAERIDTAPHHPPGKNAADFYKQAYGLFKALNLTDDEKKMLHDRSGKWDTEKAKALFEKIEPIIEMLRQSDGAAYADWGIKLKSFREPIPQVYAVTDLTQLMAWNSAYEFQSDPDRAESDLRLELQLGNSVGDQTLIGLAANIKAAELAFDTLRTNAAQLSPVASNLMLRMLQMENPAANLSKAMSSDAAVVSAFSEAIANGTQGLPIDLTPEERAYYNANPTSPAGEYEWFASIEPQFAENALLPEVQFESWWQAIQQASGYKPLAISALQSFPSTRASLLENQVQNSMLQAGLSILQNGNSALATYPDPITKQPFTLVPTADGFKLQSTFQFQGKPVVMPFPTAKP